jgi:hypothetical protein
MTCLTVERIIQLLVVRISGVVIILLMARHTIRGKSYVLAAAVAVGTIRQPMCPSQGKIIMNEDCPFPRDGICSMANLTTRRIACKPVIRLGCLVIIPLMTGDTLRRKS